MRLKIATCQFPISGKISRNLGYVLRQMQAARRRGAVIAHFPETALSGYAGFDLDSAEDLDWGQLGAATREVMALARTLGVWVVLGSSHRLTGRHKPHNSVYVIDALGRIVTRYDKMFCTGNPAGTGGDLRNYSPGNEFCTFTCRGVRCGVLICHDVRYPELARVYKSLGVQILFHSFYNLTPARRRKSARLKRITITATLQSWAASNALWISASNTCGRLADWGSYAVQPDGMIVGRLARHRPGVLITTVDTRAEFYDASKYWRDRAIAGVYHSGRLVRDPRSRDRTCL